MQTDKNTDKKAVEARQPVESTQIETLTWEAWQEPKPRNYDDAMVEDLAKTHAQTLVKLDKANAHADKLAEAGERLKNAVSDLINEPRTLEIEHYAETALHDWQSTLAAYESDKQ